MTTVKDQKIKDQGHVTYQKQIYYNVQWQRKVVSTSNLVEIIIVGRRNM